MIEKYEAVNNLTKLVNLRKSKAGEIKHDTCICSTRDIEIALNLIQKQQEEIDLLKEQKEYVINEYGATIEKQGKIIDLMAEWIFDKDYVENSLLISREDYYSNCIKQVKQYFEKKVEDK